MPKYLIRDISAGLWARVKDRAAAETPAGQPWRLDRVLLTLLDLYATYGLAFIVSRAERQLTPGWSPGPPSAPPAGDGSAPAPPRAAGPAAPGSDGTCSNIRPR